MHHIAKCLDRFLIYNNTLSLVGILGLVVLSTIGSDHWPISLSKHSLGTPLYCPFSFEKFWLKHVDFNSSMEEWWTSMQVT